MDLRHINVRVTDVASLATKKFKRFHHQLKELYIRTYVKACQEYYVISVSQHQRKAFFICMFIFLIGSVWGESYIQENIQPYFQNYRRIEGLRTLFLTLGGALMGASAISFSFIMFALQVNVERLPYGLFRKFSSDPRLLWMVTFTFLMSISIACFSIFIEISYVTAFFVSAFWITVIIFVLFYETYKRALDLINAKEQLKIVVKEAKQDMLMWVRRSKRARPLILLNSGEYMPDTSQDLPHQTFLLLNPAWVSTTKKAISSSISFFHQSAKKDDYESSASALNSIVTLNSDYIEAKGKTFYAQNPIMDNPLSSDEIIAHTLEGLRKALRVVLIKSDEQLIEQILQASRNLIILYLKIEYSNPHDAKTHAHLAMKYLSDGILSIAPHNFVDVLMEGIRCMGSSTKFMLGVDQPEYITSLTEPIMQTGCLGIKDENHRPLTVTAMGELTSITLNMLRTRGQDLKYAFKDIRENIQSLTKLFLLVPNDPFSMIHSTYLAPYFSSTSQDTFRSQFTNIVNYLIELEEDDEDAKTIISNIFSWSDQLNLSMKELLLFAIEKRLSFTHDIIFWITGISDVLIASTHSVACDDWHKNKIEENAVRLLLTLSWVPDDAEALSFIHAYNIEEHLFDAVLEGRTRDCIDYKDTAQEQLLNFGFKAINCPRGQHIFKQVLYAVSALAVIDNNAPWITRELRSRIATNDQLTQEIRGNVAQDIRQRNQNLGFNRARHSKIDSAIEGLDREDVAAMLENIAALLDGEE